MTGRTRTASVHSLRSRLVGTPSARSCRPGAPRPSTLPRSAIVLLALRSRLVGTPSPRSRRPGAPRPSPWTRSAIALLALAAAALLGGCASVHGTEPNARLLGTELTDLSFEGVTVLMDVEVNNPTKVPLPIDRMDYALTLGDERAAAASGPVEIPAVIAPRSAERLKVPARIAFVELLARSLVARPGSVIPYVASVSVEARDPDGGTLDLDAELPGELPVPVLPQVVVKEVTWEDAGILGASGRVVLSITNPNAFEIALKRLKWSLSLGGKEIVAGKVKPTTFAPGATEEVVLPIGVSTFGLGRSMLSVSQGGPASYDFSADLRVKTPYGELGGPVQRSGSGR